eukprot:TRINITY_DN434_c0_g1_i1.p1 TRINITY_DN434_c0_g1~~TRINITY_DN434_c0_g1_i1.p1  ORF type:complete len:263 (+),score=75.90 TRINITY_DN434_c0_g1_i1:49-789(+)
MSDSTWKYENEQPDPSKIIFYGNKICPFAHRAWWSLLEKELDHEFIFVGLGAAKPQWLNKLNPKSKIPVIQYQGQVLTESSILAQLVDELTPEKGSLAGDTPMERYYARIFLEELSSLVGEFYGLLGSTPNDNETQKTKLTASLVKANNLLLAQDAINAKNSVSGPYVLGNKLSFAEVFLIPFFERKSVTLSHYHNFDIFSSPEGELTRLKQWWTASRERPAFQKTLNEINSQFWIDSYAGYVKKA